MDSNNYIELAKSYVALSNKHDLKLIELMFEQNATYHSSFFGVFTGINEISKMMADFFSRFPDVYWDVSVYQQVEDGKVAFAFVMTATDAATGEFVKRRGFEEISFTLDGLINHIEVQPSRETETVITTD